MYYLSHEFHTSVNMLSKLSIKTEAEKKFPAQSTLSKCFLSSGNYSKFSWEKNGP
jgi:hypothetical protein